VAALPPTVAHAAQLSVATPAQSSPLSIVDVTWNATLDTSYAIVWKRCDSAGANCTVITGATATAYAPTAADVGHTLIAAETATNPDGSATATTPASQVIVPAAPRWRDLPVITSSSTAVGGALGITAGVWTGPAVTSDVVDVMRCTSTCVAVSSAAQYTIVTADVGAILRLRETASNAGGATVVWSAQYVGPVTSVASAAAVLSSGQAVLRNSRGQALATAEVSSSATMGANALTRGGARLTSGSRSGANREVTIRRARRLHARLRAWACRVATPSAAAPPPCTRQIILGATGRLVLPASLGSRVRVVVVLRGH
jgi:Ig domain of plant-specific actin-binding protein